MASRSRADTSAANAPDPALPLERQARRRLIGAATLVLVVGVLFSLFFDAEPRGTRDDVQVRIPAREAAGAAGAQPGGSAAPVGPTAAAGAGAATDGASTGPAGGGAAPGAQSQAGAAAGQAGEPRHEAVAEAAPAGQGVAEPVPPSPLPAPLAAASKAETAASKAETAASKNEAGARPPAKTARAEAKPDAKPDGKVGGYFLQVGAFASDKAATDQVERIRRLGASAFKETIRTQQGERIRVRLGPYPTREAADPIRNRLRAAGIDVTLVTP
jgi:DedD protein